MENITIRKAQENDLEAIIKLFDELTISDLPYDKEIDIDWGHGKKGKTYFMEKITGKDGVCFVAEVNKTVVGYFTAGEKEVPSYRLVKVAELQNLVVAANLRNNGIGEKLMQAFFAWAKGIGAQKVAVNVFTQNNKAINFYLREGFLPFENTLEMAIKP